MKTGAKIGIGVSGGLLGLGILYFLNNKNNSTVTVNPEVDKSIRESIKPAFDKIKKKIEEEIIQPMTKVELDEELENLKGVGFSENDAKIKMNKIINDFDKKNKMLNDILGNVKQNYDTIIDWKRGILKNQPSLIKLKNEDNGLLQDPIYVQAMSDLNDLMYPKGGKKRRTYTKKTNKKMLSKKRRQI